MSALASEIEAAVARAVAPLIEQIERFTNGQASPPKAKRMLSIQDMVDGYDIGRREIARLIETGKMKAVQRRARGGRASWVVDRSEAERVLAGKP